MSRFVCALLILLVAGSASPARSEDPPTILDYYRAYTEAYNAGDYEAFLENVRGALTLRPEHPRLMYNMACAHALLGHPQEAWPWLERLAGAGLFYPAAADSDLVSLWGEPRFQGLVRRFEANTEPRGTCTEVLRLPERGLILESVARDSASERYFLSSVRERKVLVHEDGRVRDFTAPADSLWGVFGLKVDPGRGLLWACTAAVPQINGFRPELEGRTALVGLSLEDGSVRHRFDVPSDGGPHLLGDVVVAPSGALYATDSFAPRVYTVGADLDSLRVLATLEGFVSPQGVDLNAAGDLIVADYLNGILALNPNTGAQERLAHPDTVCVFGIDGLYAVEGGLIAVQNGTNPQRVIHLSLEGRRITGSRVLASGHPDFEEPTLGLVSGDAFLFVGSSQWGAYDGQGRPVEGVEHVPHIVFQTSWK